MANRFFLGFIAIFFIQVSGLLAQTPTGYYVDAANYSRTNVMGSARFQGFAGAGSALGADLSSTVLNPAGLGVYRKSEFSLSTGLGFTGANATFLGEINKDSRSYLYFPNIGIAISNRKEDIEPGAWRGGTFAFTYNRVNNLQSKSFFSGINNNNSLLGSFVQLLNNNPGSVDFDADVNQIVDLPTLVYLSYLTELGDNQFYNPFDSSYYGSPYYDVHKSTLPTYQEETITTRGGQNQINLAYGGNIADKLYFGAGLGIAVLRSETTKEFFEEPQDSSGLENFTFNQTFSTKGTGINFNIGLIFRPSDALRLGLSFQTPTFYSITENYRYAIFSNFNPDYVVPGAGFAPGNQDNKTIPQDFKYKLSTPSVLRGGISWIAGKHGFLSADVVYIPYSAARLGTKGGFDYLKWDNRLIKNKFASTFNYKVGGELRLDIFRLRAGFGLIGDPLRNLDEEKVNRKIYTFTVGAGFKLSDFYLDLAVVNSQQNSYFRPYSLNEGGSPSAAIKNKNTGVVITFGTYF